MFLNAGCSFDSVCWPFFPCPISCYGPLIMSSKVSYGFIHGVKSIPLDTQVRKFTLIITLLCDRRIAALCVLHSPSVCLFIRLSHGLVTRKQKSRKIKLAYTVDVPQGRSKRCANFQLKRSKVKVAGCKASKSPKSGTCSAYADYTLGLRHC